MPLRHAALWLRPRCSARCTHLRCMPGKLPTRCRSAQPQPGRCADAAQQRPQAPVMRVGSTAGPGAEAGASAGMAAWRLCLDSPCAPLSSAPAAVAEQAGASASSRWLPLFLRLVVALTLAMRPEDRRVCPTSLAVLLSWPVPLTRRLRSPSGSGARQGAAEHPSGTAESSGPLLSNSAAAAAALAGRALMLGHCCAAAIERGESGARARGPTLGDPGCRVWCRERAASDRRAKEAQSSPAQPTRARPRAGSPATCRGCALWQVQPQPQSAPHQRWSGAVPRAHTVVQWPRLRRRRSGGAVPACLHLTCPAAALAPLPRCPASCLGHNTDGPAWPCTVRQRPC
jgi:hypothetical protein